MTIMRARRFRRAGLLFAALFVFAVVTQLGVGWYPRRVAAGAALHATVDGVRKEVRYESRWELTRLRQSDLGGGYWIVDASGLIEGFAADLTFVADVTDLQPGIHVHGRYISLVLPTCAGILGQTLSTWYRSAYGYSDFYAKSLGGRGIAGCRPVTASEG
jgi:hypothetical protein